MKTNYLKIVSACVLGLFVLGANMTMGQYNTTKAPPSTGGSPAAGGGDAKKPGSVIEGGVIVATPITKEEAAKKYPAPSSGYPTGSREPHMKSGLVLSPYPPHKQFDCSNIARGGLILDTYANHVFLRP